MKFRIQQKLLKRPVRVQYPISILNHIVVVLSFIILFPAFHAGLLILYPFGILIA
jgi:hypothetical protein